MLVNLVVFELSSLTHAGHSPKNKTIKQTCSESYEPQGPHTANIPGQSGRRHVWLGVTSCGIGESEHG